MNDKVGHSGPAETSGKPTLKTIAGLAGLAVTTVSRALSDDKQIALETRRRVAKIAEQVGYVPDRAAQHLRTGRTNTIALLLNPHEELLGFGTTLIGGITEALSETRYHLTITPSFDDDNGLSLVRNNLRNKLADGIIFSRTQPFDPRIRLLLEAEFPFVSHGRTEFGTPHPYVDYDNETFARLAVHRLFERGRRKLAIVLPPPQFTFHQHMHYGFVAAVRELGVAYEIADQVHLDSTPSQIADFVRQRRQMPDPPDGYICGGEISALATVNALRETGVRAGTDVDIVGKQTSETLDLFRPDIDTIYEDIWAAGHGLGDLLIRRINGEPAADLQTLLKPEPRFRELAVLEDG